MVAFLGAATNWLLFTSLIGATGALAARWVLIPRAAALLPPAIPEISSSAARLAAISALALPVALALVFARQLWEFRDPFAPLSEDASLLLTATAWGRTWMAAAIVSLVALVASRLVRRAVPGGWGLSTVAVLALAAYPALSGHASGAQGLTALTIPADAVHVLAAGAWMGGLAFVLFAERLWRAGAARTPSSLLPTLVPIFSPLAVVSVGLLLATGVFAGFVQVSDWAALFRSTYGRLLLAKVVLALTVMGIGAVNWRRMTPALAEPDGAERLRRSAMLELTVAQLVLVVTAVLVRTAPMGH